MPAATLLGALLLAVSGNLILSPAAAVVAVPSAPTGVTASSRDASAMVRWTAPALDVGKTVTSYKVLCVELGRSVFVGGAASSVTFGSLANGAGYTFRVSAQNEAGWGALSDPSARVFPTRPNIVIILTDDQRWDSMAQLDRTNLMPWRRFARSFVNEPQCCPSRSSILTGRYSHHTGVETLKSGEQLDESRTVATMLHASGYRTGLVGKYLNGYPFGRGYYVPPGWDDFRAFVGSIVYFGYSLAENGTLIQYGDAAGDYSTDVLTAKSVAFVRTTARTRPVMLELAYNAPHNTPTGLPVPAASDVGSCTGVAFPMPASFNARDTVGEPQWMNGEYPVSSSVMVEQRRATCETLGGVDDGVQAVLAELQAQGRLDNTYVVFTSDNGYAFGEHRLTGKGDLYESSIRVPLLVRGPDVVAGVSQRLTSNVDLAPTIAEWARVTPPTGFFDGRSFAAEARGAQLVSKPIAVLLRGCRTSRTGALGPVCGGYRTDMGMSWGLRTSQFKYVEYPGGYVQLFDLAVDPNERTNLASNAAYASARTGLRTMLAAMRSG